MKKYSVNGLSASSTGPKTANTVGATAAIRPLCSEFTIGLRTAPNATDQQIEWAIGSVSALGTSTAKTPKPLDFQDPVVAVSVGGITHSIEPTYDATYWLDTDINQRGMYRWVAEIGFELAPNVGAATGIGIKMIASTAAIVMSSPTHFKE